METCLSNLEAVAGVALGVSITIREWVKVKTDTFD